MFLQVSYTDEHSSFPRDEELNKIAGKPSCSSGTLIATNERDLEWEFENEKDMLPVFFAMRKLDGIKIISPKYKID